jgi:hypothetical protein
MGSIRIFSSSSQIHGSLTGQLNPAVLLLGSGWLSLLESGSVFAVLWILRIHFGLAVSGSVLRIRIRIQEANKSEENSNFEVLNVLFRFEGWDFFCSLDVPYGGLG